VQHPNGAQLAWQEGIGGDGGGDGGGGGAESTLQQEGAHAGLHVEVDGGEQHAVA